MNDGRAADDEWAVNEERTDNGGGEPDDQLDPILLDPTRLRVAATLLAAGEIEFRFVRDRVGLTDSALSKQVKALSEAGLVGSRRERTGPARRVWLRLTPPGRARLRAHANALRSIVESPAHGGTGDRTDPLTAWSGESDLT